jgi:hypothetical protein
MKWVFWGNKTYTLKTKTRKKNKFRSSTVIGLKMIFFRIKNVLYLKKNVRFSGTNHVLCLKKQHFWHFFGTGPESERKKDFFFLRVYGLLWRTEYLRLHREAKSDEIILVMISLPWNGTFCEVLSKSKTLKNIFLLFFIKLFLGHLNFKSAWFCYYWNKINE